MKLSPSFNDNEFFTLPTYQKIIDGNHIPGWHINKELVTRLQKIRDHFRKPLKITRGYSTASENTVAGSETEWSFHCSGNAADFYIPGISSQEIFDYVNLIWHTGAVGMINKEAVHLDVRNNVSLQIIKY